MILWCFWTNIRIGENFPNIEHSSFRSFYAELAVIYLFELANRQWLGLSFVIVRLIVPSRSIVYLLSVVIVLHIIVTGCCVTTSRDERRGLKTMCYRRFHVTWSIQHDRPTTLSSTYHFHREGSPALNSSWHVDFLWKYPRMSNYFRVTFVPHCRALTVSFKYQNSRQNTQILLYKIQKLMIPS